jgi:hypothetical protein
VVSPLVAFSARPARDFNAIAELKALLEECERF